MTIIKDNDGNIWNWVNDYVTEQDSILNFSTYFNVYVMGWFMNIFQLKYHVKSTKLLQSEAEEHYEMHRGRLFMLNETINPIIRGILEFDLIKHQ